MFHREFTIDWYELEPSQLDKFLIVEGEILIGKKII